MMFRATTALWLLVLVPFLAVFLATRENTRASIARRFVSERLRGGASPARRLRPWLIVVAFVLSVLALAGPYAGYTLVPIVAREANRVVIIDVSNSMAAEDVGASRLTAAKALAMQIVEEQQGRVALVVFEAEPSVASPLTSDTVAVRELIDSLRPGEVGQPGSDIGSAILASMKLIEDDPAQKADLVVMSDGEDQGAHVAEAVQRAKARGVAVSTIVIGSAQGSTIPTPNGPLHDTSGEIVTTVARTEVMEEIAKNTGGRAFVNPFSAHALDSLSSGASAATARETQARSPIDRYQWPLAIAFAALFLGSFVNRGAE